MAELLRVGAVAYLNSKPLIYRFEQTAPRARLELELPSRLADALEAARLDVALVPVFECFLHPEWEVVSDACIASEGAVYSVKLFSRTAIEEIRTVALDEGSRTSVALVKILLQQRCGVRPQWEPLPMGADASRCAADAVLLIGDRAIHPPVGRWRVVWDLGEEWTRWTGLPFVFAVWASRPGIDYGGLGEALERVRDLGVEHVREIAALEGPAVGMTAEECLRYLTVNLRYCLGKREQEGLTLFRTKAAALHLLPEGGEWRVGTVRETESVIRGE